MPRYFFHLRHRNESKDSDGVDLPGFDEAWAEAVRSYGEMLRDFEGSLAPGQPFELTVSKGDGVALARLSLSIDFFDP